MRPIDEKLLRLETRSGENWSLPGNQCRDCGEMYHPARYRCAKCTSANLVDVDLPKVGSVVSCTQVHQTHPDSMVQPPYWLAVIRLQDGPIIEAISPAAVEPEPPRIGGQVRLDLFPLGVADDGEEIVTYVFRHNDRRGGPR